MNQSPVLKRIPTIATPLKEDLNSSSKYKELYNDLQQQLKCEKKLNLKMTDVLENKVSELIAENSTLKLSNI